MKAEKRTVLVCFDQTFLGIFSFVGGFWRSDFGFCIWQVGGKMNGSQETT